MTFDIVWRYVVLPITLGVTFAVLVTQVRKFFIDIGEDWR